MTAIEIARQAGSCFGVERALVKAREAIDESPKPVHTLGAIIHNPKVVSKLAAKGVTEVDEPAQAGEGTLLIRAHGVPPAIEQDARDLGLHVIDATCPFVKRVHKAASQLAREGYQVVIVGEEGHPEVMGIKGYAGDDSVTISSIEDAESFAPAQRIGIVVQTTQTAEFLSRVVAIIAPRVRELRVINTICSATSERQDAARELAGRAGCMLVVGGKSSGNTRRLAQICAEECSNTHHIEDASEIDSAWLAGCDLVGITAGASTPQDQIDAVRAAVGKAVES